MRLRLREIREERGVTLRELSARSGVAKSSLEAMESEQPNPSLQTLRRVAKALNVRIADLIDEEANWDCD